MTEQEMRLVLLAQPALSALIGERLYPLTLPQGATMPAMTYAVISGNTPGTHSGPGLSRRRYQFDCWGTTYSSADAVATALSDAVSSKRGVIGQASLLDNEVDQYDPETKRYRRIVDVMVYGA